jgi:hypothetical protein
VTDLLKALLGSSPVGTFQLTRRAKILWKCFLRVREWTVVIQRMCGDVTQVRRAHVTCAFCDSR